MTGNDPLSNEVRIILEFTHVLLRRPDLSHEGDDAIDE